MIIWSLLIVTITTAYFIQSRKLRWLPPSSSAMLLGIIAGIVSRVAGLAQPLRFSPTTFFYALLPPIVYQARAAHALSEGMLGDPVIAASAGSAAVQSAVRPNDHRGPAPTNPCRRASPSRSGSSSQTRARSWCMR